MSSLMDARVFPGATDFEIRRPEPPKPKEWDGVTTEGPVVALLIGMAGSGKSTLYHRLFYDAVEDPEKERKRVYFVNLDPATLESPVEADIDIRDTVDYKGVMREYSLGPNGAIVTSLNLFATQFHEVMAILEKRAKDFDYVIIDTPGQIEAFTWSASGQLLAETLASTFATAVVYVVDTPRSRSPSTFMSNMVYACSILHKYQLPLIAAFNKADVADPENDCFQWMDDFEAFHLALDDAENQGESYVTSLHRSMSLVLDEFYKVLDRVSVSAADGRGIDSLWSKLAKSKTLYDTSYGNEIRRRIKQRQSEDIKKPRGLGISEANPFYDPSLAARIQRPDAPVDSVPVPIPEEVFEDDEDDDEDDMDDDDDDDATASVTTEATLPPGQLPGQPSPLPRGVRTTSAEPATKYSRGAPPAISRSKRT